MLVKPRISKLPKPAMNRIIAHKDVTEWVMDDKGYFLIDPRPNEGIIYAHHYNKDRTYNCSVEGSNAESMYYTIVREGLVTSFMHAAYIGSELQKAELLVRYHNGTYVQDEPLYLNTTGEEEEE